MINYYEELNLDSSSDLSELNKALSQLESTWKRREITSPEKSTSLDSMKKLASELHEHIGRWIIAQGRKLDENAGNEKHIAALGKWNGFN